MYENSKTRIMGHVLGKLYCLVTTIENKPVPVYDCV